MGIRVAQVVCVCFIAQLMVCEAKPSKAETEAYQLPALKKDELIDLDERLKSLEKDLEQHPREYAIIKAFAEKPSCEIAGLEWRGGGVILQALRVAAAMVAEGCSYGVHKTMWYMVNALSPDEVFPVHVTDYSPCSSEADEGIRILLSEVPILKDVYILVTAGLSMSSNCVGLAADLLPTVVQISFEMFNRTEKLGNYQELKSPEEIFSLCSGELHRLNDELKGDKQVKDNSRRKRQDTCEKSWEKSIYDSVKSIPVIGALWELGSALGYAIAGCSDVASERGREGASSVAQVLTTYFVAS